MVGTSQQVAECIAEQRSFIVDAGAGSGKTRTLIDALRFLLSKDAKTFLRANQQIVCITYTNVAANEIISRINRDPLVRVSTIHEFLWSIIQPYQNELKIAVTEINDAAGEKRVDLDLSKLSIEYWQYPRKLEKGKIGHDDVIAISADLFQKYPKLTRIFISRYPIIFVDEYQDTHPSTINLLLDNVLRNNVGRVTIGLFGDHMQKIYNTGVGRVEREGLLIIQKMENYRSSIAVIDVLNRLRPQLQQVPAGNNKEGRARFFYCVDVFDDAATRLYASLKLEGWSERNSKVLMLTKRGIAKNLQWADLLGVYQKRSRFGVDDLTAREDEFGELFDQIESISASFNEGRFGDFLAMYEGTKARIKRHLDKKEVASQVAVLDRLRREGTTGEVLDYVFDSGMLRKPRRVQELEEGVSSSGNPDRAEKDRKFLEDLRKVPFNQVSALERYLNKETPFSTNHGVKGEEYDNVLVALDDTLWNQYKFELVLSNDASKSQYQRSLNLLYVACSRARNDLAVIAVSPISEAALEGARRIFGAENVLPWRPADVPLE